MTFQAGKTPLLRVIAFQPSGLARLTARLISFLTGTFLLCHIPGNALGGSSGERTPAHQEEIEPVLEQYCYECHGLGAKKGGVALDSIFEPAAARQNPAAWLAVLKNVRSGIMPPAGKPQVSAEDRALLENWIKHEVFQIDPMNADPGRVTVRRLNRVEYRNTIKDLTGVDYDTSAEFPPDDTGHGFDNIGDVLTISPLLLEKYLAAANSIIAQTVPRTSKVIAERMVSGRQFQRPASERIALVVENPPGGTDADRKSRINPGSLSYYEPGSLALEVPISQAADYRLVLDISASERYVDGQNDANRCQLWIRADGEVLHTQEFTRQDNKLYRFEYDRAWQPGTHVISLEVQPLTPGEKQVRSLTLSVKSLTFRGPLDQKFWVRPPNYERYFPGTVPEDPEERRQYTRELLGRFAERAFRRPIDDTTKNRLAALVEAYASGDGKTFEQGVGQGMVAILASPRFLFRQEETEAGSPGLYPPVDEYTLASRLSYFLWSTMPDEELMRLAAHGQLRGNLQAQVTRMLADPRSAQFFRHFVGQWLQARDIETVNINATAVLARDREADANYEQRREQFRALIRKPPEELTEAEKEEIKAARLAFEESGRRSRNFELNDVLRRAMRRETEMLFEHVLRQDRPLVELLDSNYAFLNDRLARQYGIKDVIGEEMRLVELPEDSPRGGILTQGTLLAVTSNPDRTSPVKRGLYILENILGSPPAPPPPNIPTLEDAGNKIEDHVPTVREAMVLHRSEPSCAGCHSRMDPLGLSLENFNALGLWRETERAGSIDASGTLITGEPFQDARALKKILVANHSREFQRCLTEKLLTYALGRGLDYHDVQTVDAIVEKIEASGGKASALLAGILESAPFQKTRPMTDSQAAHLATPEPESNPVVASEAP